MNVPPKTNVGVKEKILNQNMTELLFLFYCKDQVRKHINLFEIFNGKHTQNKCNGVVGEPPCTCKEENEGEDLPAGGEYLRCDCHSLKSHHEEECWPPPIPVQEIQFVVS